MARTTEPYGALFTELDQQVAAGDEITARVWGLTGWSLNWWMILSPAFAVLLVLPFILSLKHLYVADIAICGAAGVLLSASFWTRPGLVIAVTEQRQLLCCRTARPARRKTITMGPVEAAAFTGFRRGWLYDSLQYRGPGTDGKTVRLNVPAVCRPAARALASAGSAVSAN